MMASNTQNVYITEINVFDVEKRYKPSKHYVYCIWVFWSDHRKQLIFRRYSQFFELQCKLLDRFKVEAGLYDPSQRQLPFLPGKIIFGRSHIKSVALDRLHFINLYCKKLITLKKEISRCDLVLKFFQLNNDDIAQSSTSKLKIKEEAPDKTNPTTISKPFKPDEYICIHNYRPLSKTELNLKKGTKVFVIEKNLNGWWFVDSRTEGQGYVPKCVLEALKEAPSDDDSPIQSEKNEKYIGTHDYIPRKPDELEFKKGDYLEIVEKNLNGWWRVKLINSEKIGIVPAVYLKKLASSSDPVKSAMSAWDLFGSNDDYVPPRNDFISISDAKSITNSLEENEQHEQNESNLSASVPSLFDEDVYYVIQDYQDDTGDVIGRLQQGQRVVVLDKENSSGWWFVRLDDSTDGWAPSAFLSKEKPKPPRPPKPPKPDISTATSVPDLIESSSDLKRDLKRKVFPDTIINKRDNFSTHADNNKATVVETVEYKPVKVSEMRKRFENR